MPSAITDISRHYSPGELTERITAGLEAAGLDPARLTTASLERLDQFHTGGADATRELARMAGLQPGTHVLDLGGGIGGAARLLASEFDCDVTVLDVTAPYCRVGEMLTRATGLSEHVRFRTGDALEPPFPAGSFDVVWTQHSTMNMADKRSLYRSAARMLRPGGLLAMHEIAAGAHGPVHYPSPWAPDERISHLLQPDELRRTIEAAGFIMRAWEDATAQATEWFKTRLANAPPSPPPLGLHLLLGATFRESFRNLLRNLEEDRVRVVIGAFAQQST